MSSMAQFTNSKETMWLPSMGGFYDRFARPLAWVGLRVLVGGLWSIDRHVLKKEF